MPGWVTCLAKLKLHAYTWSSLKWETQIELLNHFIYLKFESLCDSRVPPALAGREKISVSWT